jgi:hypothetical protein
MEYVPIDDLNGRPNIIVDGYPTNGTVLTLSHWPDSGSPGPLSDDLSTQIVFRYLDGAERVDADLVSNNHFDQDGLCGIFALIHPDQAEQQRDLLIDVASAGDFATYQDRNAARIAIALAAYETSEDSPIARELAGKPYGKQTAILYRDLLGELPEMLEHPDRFRRFWEAEDARIDESEKAIASGTVTIAEQHDIDLATVVVPEDFPDADDNEWSGGIHPMALHNGTTRHRILIQRGNRYRLRYRYETWVKFSSRPVTPRVDLGPLADRLSGEEKEGQWKFDGIDQITPSLHLEGNEESAIAPQRFRTIVEEFLTPS